MGPSRRGGCVDARTNDHHRTMFKDKDGADGPRFGFAAEWTATNDKRLVYFDKGKPHAVDYERYTAVLTKVLQCGMN